MSLSGLLPLLYDQPGYGTLARSVASGENAWSEAPFDPARPYLLSAIHADITSGQGRPMIVVAPRSDRARQLYEGLLAYSPPGSPILYFPAPDLLPYERIAPDPTIVGERLRVLASIGVRGQEPPAPQSPIIVTSVLALMQPTMAPADMAHAMRLLRKGDRVDLRELLGHLVDLGYESVALVEEPGQFSKRGGIIDIYPPASSLPIRIELFGDELDSVRLFNPLTQRSEGQANGLVITPSCEMPLWRRAGAFEQIRRINTDNLREEVLEEWQAELQKTEMGECFEGMELFAPYYTQPLASLADYLGQLRGDNDSAAPLLVLDDPELIGLEAAEIERQAAELYKGFVDNGELPPGLLRPYLTWEEVSAHGRDLPTLSMGGGAEGAIEVPEFAAPHLYAGNVAAAIEDIKGMLSAKSRIVIVSQQSARLRELLEDEDVYPTLRKASLPDEGRRTKDEGRQSSIRNPQSAIVGVEQVALSAGGKGIVESLLSVPPPGTVNLLQGTLLAGWQLRQFAAPDVVMLTDAELFGRSQVARRQAPGPARRSNADAAALLREKMLLELQPGDYVVHVEHGIAKYGGLVKMEREGRARQDLRVAGRPGRARAARALLHVQRHPQAGDELARRQRGQLRHSPRPAGDVVRGLAAELDVARGRARAHLRRARDGGGAAGAVAVADLHARLPPAGDRPGDRPAPGVRGLPEPGQLRARDDRVHAVPDPG